MGRVALDKTFLSPWKVLLLPSLNFDFMKFSFVKTALFSALLASASILTSCEGEVKTEQNVASIDRPIGSELDVFWNLVENGFKKKSSYLSEFMITNNSSKTLDSTGWAIYFHQPRRVILDATSENIKIMLMEITSG